MEEFGGLEMTFDGTNMGSDGAFDFQMDGASGFDVGEMFGNVLNPRRPNVGLAQTQVPTITNVTPANISQQTGGHVIHQTGPAISQVQIARNPTQQGMSATITTTTIAPAVGNLHFGSPSVIQSPPPCRPVQQIHTMQPQSTVPGTVQAPPNDYMTLSLLSLACFFPIGVFAVLKSHESRRRSQAGHYEEAQALGNLATVLSVVSILAGTAVTTLIIIVAALS